MSQSRPPKLTLIAAVAANGVIGRGGTLPWRLSADLQRFKRLTLGKPVIMGRKTWESLGRPLPGRHNIVITRQADYRVDSPEVSVVVDLPAALQVAGDVPVDPKDGSVDIEENQFHERRFVPPGGAGSASVRDLHLQA